MTAIDSVTLQLIDNALKSVAKEEQKVKNNSIVELSLFHGF